jgi:hypothetical protein
MGRCASENFGSRLTDHAEGTGSEWTRIFPIQGELAVRHNQDRLDEDKWVLKMMQAYGIDNVRGGQYSQVVLSADDRRQINRAFVGANDLCFACGSISHFVQNCPGRAQSAHASVVPLPAQQLPTSLELDEALAKYVFPLPKK